MSHAFRDVQRIVLHGSRWQAARHLVLTFAEGSSPLHFLHRLGQLKSGCWPSAADARKPAVQVSLGFSRRGLEHAHMPAHVLACFALKAPAFCAGAPLRASRHLGASGCNVPDRWNPAFGFTTLDAVLSLHATDERRLDDEVLNIEPIARETGVHVATLLPARRLREAPAGETPDQHAQWVHFGYRDGLSRIGIDGCSPAKVIAACSPTSRHAAGEFLLGHAQDSGANPWIAGPGLRVWPEELRGFFRNGSFGVLHQLEQDVGGFERFVQEQARRTGLAPREIKAKLCGRYPDGAPLAAAHARPQDDFGFGSDPEGHCCPFGSHIRRMNPRGDGLAHAGRTRALLRRGMPYGTPWQPNGDADRNRGLIGHFFCASIEDQFEHVLGQWADRVPLGSEDRGGARDPLIGAHEHGDGPFEIPQADGKPALLLHGLQPFTRTLGTAYLFYPSLSTLQGIADSSLWGAVAEDDGWRS